jgi:hypothetical protein
VGWLFSYFLRRMKSLFLAGPQEQELLPANQNQLAVFFSFPVLVFILLYSRLKKKIDRTLFHCVSGTKSHLR